jgi:hypothetical protein
MNKLTEEEFSALVGLRKADRGARPLKVSAAQQLQPRSMDFSFLLKTEMFLDSKK